jgi:hypothetical protein
MSYLRAAGSVENYRNYIEAKGAVIYIVGCKKILSSPEQPGFFRMCDGRFGWSKGFIGSGSDLNKNQGAVGINHNQVDFAGLAGEVASEFFEAFPFQKPQAAFFTPPAEQCPVGQ